MEVQPQVKGEAPSQPQVGSLLEAPAETPAERQAEAPPLESLLKAQLEELPATLSGPWQTMTSCGAVGPKPAQIGKLVAALLFVQSDRFQELPISLFGCTLNCELWPAQVCYCYLYGFASWWLDSLAEVCLFFG